MLELEIEVEPGLTGDLASRIMAIKPDLEVAARENCVSFHLPVDDSLDRYLQRFEETLQTLERIRAIDQPLPVRARNLAGPDSAPSVLRSGRFIIRHPDVKVNPQPGEIVLTLEPGMAFGTGGHPSTALALVALDEYFNPPPGVPSREGCRVLDAGTGSGVLALAAARLGAGSILAIDPIEEAVRAAEMNAGICGIDCITVEQTGIEKVEGKFDLIIANMVTSVLIKNGKRLTGLLNREGTIIISGFADVQTPHVVKVITKAGLDITKSYALDGWTALTLARPFLFPDQMPQPSDG